MQLVHLPDHGSPVRLLALVRQFAISRHQTVEKPPAVTIRSAAVAAAAAVLGNRAATATAVLGNRAAIVGPPFVSAPSLSGVYACDRGRRHDRVFFQPIRAHGRRIRVVLPRGAAYRVPGYPRSNSTAVAAGGRCRRHPGPPYLVVVAVVVMSSASTATAVAVVRPVAVCRRRVDDRTVVR